MTAPATAGVGMLLRSLKLPGFVRAYAETAGQAEREGWGFERYLGELERKVLAFVEAEQRFRAARAAVDRREQRARGFDHLA